MVPLLTNACTQVFRTAYCIPFHKDGKENVLKTCSDFVAAVKWFNPAFLQKPKIHLLLHLAEDMVCFGPTAAFSAERYK